MVYRPVQIQKQAASGPLVDPHQTVARCVKEGAIAHRAVRVRPNIPTKTPDGNTQAGRVPDQEPRFLIQKRIGTQWELITRQPLELSNLPTEFLMSRVRSGR